MKSASRPPAQPLLALVFGILAVSTSSVFIRYAQVYAPSLVIAAYRLSLASILLAPLALSRHRMELAELSRRELGLGLLSGFFLALHFATWITSLEFTSIASSVVLVSTTPLWVALLLPFTIKEPLKRGVLLGMGIVLFGGVVVGISHSCTWTGRGLLCPSIADFTGDRAFLGNLLAVGGAVAGACYLLIGRRLRGKMSLIGYIFVVYSMAAAVLVVFMFAAGQQPVGYPAPVYLWFVFLALVPQLLGHSTFNWALRYLSAAFVSISLLGEPIGSTILAYFILQEVPSALEIIGAILILAGIYVASHSETRSVKNEA